MEGRMEGRKEGRKEGREGGKEGGREEETLSLLGASIPSELAYLLFCGTIFKFKSCSDSLE